MPARRDRQGVVVEDETQVTSRGQANDPAEARPDDGSYSGSSEDPAKVHGDAAGDPHRYDEPTRLVRRSGRRSPPGDETTIVQRPGRSRQPRSDSDDAQPRRQVDSSYKDPEGRRHYDDPTQLVRRRKGDSPVDDETTTLQSRRTQEVDRAQQDEADDPVTGWLVVVAGPGKGRSLTLGAGRNEIGRGATANVKLDCVEDFDWEDLGKQE